MIFQKAHSCLQKNSILDLLKDKSIRTLGEIFDKLSFIWWITQSWSQPTSVVKTFKDFLLFCGNLQWPKVFWLHTYMSFYCILSRIYCISYVFKSLGTCMLLQSNHFSSGLCTFDYECINVSLFGPKLDNFGMILT